VRSLYFGGGTPSMTPDLIGSVIERVAPQLGIEAEIGVEVHPRDCDTAALHRLRDRA
jgi:coproporphyrinogen III oxidase-like Fe-S oxidoreductase